MTREEHIKNLKSFLVHFEDEIEHNGYGEGWYDKEQAEKDIETFKAAISALEQQQKDEDIATDAIENALKIKESCDTISRKAVENCIRKCMSYTSLALALRDLPSVQPSRKGHWKSTIDGKPICSECGFISESEDGYFVSHYCPNCGADMRGTE